MGILLTKKFRFETAHRLHKGYVGKCSNMHGHSWNGEIAILCPNELDEYGMGMDYADIKKLINPLIDKLDHATMLWTGDPLVKVFYEQKSEVVLFEDNPTSEVVAKMLFHETTALLKTKIKDIPLSKRPSVMYVQIEETCTTSCRYDGK